TIEYIVREAIESGIEEVLIIINSEKECIRTHFGHNVVLEDFLKSKNKTKELEIIEALPKQIHVEFTYQEEQLGLGHAVLCAEKFANNEPFALLLGDDVYVGRVEPATKQLINAYNQTGSSILGTLVVPDEDVSKYGICKPRTSSYEALVELESVVEKPKREDAPSNLAIGGRYVLTPAIFDFLKTQTRGAGGEIQLTDSILRMMSKEKVYSLAIDGRRYDIGSKKGFLDATIDFALNRSDLKEDMQEILNKHQK
ncbi:MAG: UTP--glucose-1-phosphate uridylyltransferase, partial [Anaeroplasmataceae bacterium]|nr:UTP--glucose-1-phosphate uridylyltransferase [Anaeroplasmataceae bacterium]